MHPNLIGSNVVVLVKPAMEEDAGSFSGRPYGGVATAVKKSDYMIVKRN